MITEASLEALKARIDIVDVIGSHIELKKAGANFKAPCPFHDEKNASFVVSPAKQIYKCFGCQATGDAIKFVQEYRKLDFTEAVEAIASDLNFTLEYSRGSGERKDYARLMEHVNAWYRDNLTPEVADYLTDRGLTPESIAAFEIGYAPAAHDAQIRHIKAAQFNLNDASDVGILGSGEHGVYARLTDRITFPIRNHAGKLVGFGGRIMPGSNHPAKYVNSPQTRLFDKSRQLYGYHLAKEHIYRKGTVTVTEGYMDVVMFHQAGIRTAVATMGTALTAEHCTLIKKAKSRALLCYDGDRAGRAAAIKAARLLSAKEVYGGVVLFPPGKDPADMVKSGDIDGLYALLKTPVPLIRFVIAEIAAAFDLERPENKQDALREIADYLGTLPPLIRDEYRPLVASTLRVDIAHVPGGTAQLKTPRRHLSAEDVDLAELSVIYSADGDDTLFALVIDYAAPEDFTRHVRKFNMLLNRDPALPGELLRDGVRAYTPADLMAQLRIMRIARLEKELEQIPASNLPFERKAYELRRIQGEIVKTRNELNRKGYM